MLLSGVGGVFNPPRSAASKRAFASFALYWSSFFIGGNMDPAVDFRKNPVFSEQYWKRPPNRNTGDDDGDVTYAAVGFALSCWESAEDDLASLYLTLIGSQRSSPNPALRAYGAIESGTGRRKAIAAAAEAYFDQLWDDREIQRAFMIILDAVAWASKRRDDIAHGIVVGNIVDGVKHGSFLFPPDYNTHRTNMRADPNDEAAFWSLAKYRFVAEDIRLFGHKFRDLGEAIRTHRGLLLKHDKTIIMVRAVKGGSALSP